MPSTATAGRTFFLPFCCYQVAARHAMNAGIPLFQAFSPISVQGSTDSDCINVGVKVDPACGSGGMFVQTGDFVNQKGFQENNTMTFYGQEKVEYNAQLCLMNMAVNGPTGVIKSGDDANTFFHDSHNLAG